MKHLVRPLTLCLLAISSQAAPTEPSPPAPPFVPVFVAGQQGYACYRIPALVATTNGTLIAVADGRVSNCRDIPNAIDLVCKRSLNQGRTWTPLQVIANYGKGTNSTDVYPAYGLTNAVRHVAAGDAALLLDRTNGRVWVLYDNGAYVSGQHNDRALKLELRHTDDDGLTWSAPIDVEAKNRDLRPAGTDFMASPGNGIQLLHGPHAGRLIFPVYVWAKPYYSTLIYSDDRGQTWRRGGNAGTGGGEIQIAETQDGHLLATLRNNAFVRKGVRFFSTCPDGGQTWGMPYAHTPDQPALPDPRCQASLLRLTPSDGRGDFLILANAADPNSRTNLTLRFSSDYGRTWPASKLPYAGSSAYSALTPLSSSEVGVLLEMDNYQRICFARAKVP